ncbi:hypothetical protein [Bacillus sp. RS11]
MSRFAAGSRGNRCFLRESEAAAARCFLRESEATAARCFLRESVVLT